LLDLGFKGSKAYSLLFIYCANGLVIFVLIYVDNIVITSSNAVAINSTYQGSSI